ncbi:Spy/CpxP family protein refolding chaperone [Rhodocyclus tenuis]|uniref:Putative membrane protein YgcG n=1 Tax=Rhodocyclus tenuis TaxID=1066 RepID=A0A840G3C0_RHOTE|nr:Spy/CpxP family protein refolding chaperone [Rhodocyclus tenuis]MBB4248884.1 putative membrane protein YgcG [Rhodocyclus tenuis]MBK1681528.1 hypothetical protein [Rhodocyclus tenuis]
MNKHFLIPLLLAAALCVAACAPLGGRDDNDGPGRRGPGGDNGGPSGGGGGGATVISLLQTQLAETAEALKLTPQQVVLWDAYQEKVSALMADQLRVQPYGISRLSAPQQIARKVDVVRNRLTAMEEIDEAARRLYAALDTPQKTTADRMLPGTVPGLYSGFVGDSGRNDSGKGRGEPPSGGGNRGGGMGGGGMGGGGRF